MTPTPSNPDAVAALQAALAYAEDWIAYRAFKLRVPGVQYAVLFDGEVQLSGAVGLADLDTGEPLTTSHLFRVASHSKTFTATAVLQLVEAGSLTLDTPLGDVVGELAGAPVGSVAVRELLEHGGGVIRDGVDGDFWQLVRPLPRRGRAARDGARRRHEGRAEHAVRVQQHRLLAARAGDRARRGARATTTTSAARSSGRFGLADTDPEWLPARAAEYATGYTGLVTSLDRRPIEHIDTHAMSAATGFTSTADGSRPLRRGAPPRRRAPAHRRRRSACSSAAPGRASRTMRVHAGTGSAWCSTPSPAGA